MKIPTMLWGNLCNRETPLHQVIVLHEGLETADTETDRLNSEVISYNLTPERPEVANDNYNSSPVCSQSDDDIDILTECVWHIVKDDLKRDVSKSLVRRIVAEARVRNIDTLVDDVLSWSE